VLESLIYLGDQNQGWACKVVVNSVIPIQERERCKVVADVLVEADREKSKVLKKYEIKMSVLTMYSTF
jgi:hypothetical protein